MALTFGSKEIDEDYDQFEALIESNNIDNIEHSSQLRTYFDNLKRLQLIETGHEIIDKTLRVIQDNANRVVESDEPAMNYESFRRMKKNTGYITTFGVHFINICVVDRNGELDQEP